MVLYIRVSLLRNICPGATDLCSEFIELKVNDIAKAEMVLQKELNCNKYDLLPGNIIKVYDFLSDRGVIQSYDEK